MNVETLESRVGFRSAESNCRLLRYQVASSANKHTRLPEYAEKECLNEVTGDNRISTRV